MKSQIEGMGLKDEDFFIDLRLGSKEQINNLYRANMENRGKDGGVPSKPAVDGKAPFTQSLGTMGDLANNLTLDPMSPKTTTNKTKTQGEIVETMPLFLSDHYKEHFNRIKNEQEALAAQTLSPIGSDAKKKVKGGTKMYRSEWLLEKLV